MIKSNITLNLKGLKKFKDTIDNELSGKTTSGPIRAAMKQWEYRYRAAMQARFIKLSKGGGEWPPLKASTIKGRRKGKTKTKSKGSDTLPKAMILRDTGTLLNVLSPSFSGLPGQFRKDIKYGVQVGYGGPSKYPSGSASIADIASFHQVGAGWLPVRRILIDPPAQLVAQMAQDMQRALKKLSDNTIDGE